MNVRCKRYGNSGGHGTSPETPGPRSLQMSGQTGLSCCASLKYRLVCYVKGMSSKVRYRRARELLRAANKLFYDEGIHTVGIDRVIERAGVAKASLYSAFGSKDELIRADFGGNRFDMRKKRIQEAVGRHTAPRARILAVFDMLGEMFATPEYRGCAFVRASADGSSEKSVKGVCDDARGWLRSISSGFAARRGSPIPRR